MIFRGLFCLGLVLLTKNVLIAQHWDDGITAFGQKDKTPPTWLQRGGPSDSGRTTETVTIGENEYKNDEETATCSPEPGNTPDPGRACCLNEKNKTCDHANLVSESIAGSEVYKFTCTNPGDTEVKPGSNICDEDCIYNPEALPTVTFSIDECSGDNLKNCLWTNSPCELKENNLECTVTCQPGEPIVSKSTGSNSVTWSGDCSSNPCEIECPDYGENREGRAELVKSNTTSSSNNECVVDGKPVDCNSIQTSNNSGSAGVGSQTERPIVSICCQWWAGYCDYVSARQGMSCSQVDKKFSDCGTTCDIKSKNNNNNNNNNNNGTVTQHPTPTPTPSLCILDNKGHLQCT